MKYGAPKIKIGCCHIYPLSDKYWKTLHSDVAKHCHLLKDPILPEWHLSTSDYGGDIC